MDPLFILTWVLLNAAAYGMAFGAGTALVKWLGRPWRRAAGAHWTERARLAYAPGAALIWLVVGLPPIAVIMAGVGLKVFYPRDPAEMPGFWISWLAAIAGVMTARFRWLRELWGPRVTGRSWLAGCLVLMLLFLPHLLIMLLLIVLLPDPPNVWTALVIGAGLLAMAFFAFGGGVLLLRLIRVMRPAPAHVTAMVEQLALEMKVPGRVSVFELEWVQVNAVAWETYRAVGFSRALLEVMTQQEVRAIAAHELAHLIEPAWVRTVRVVHMFAYLAAAPVMKYGGSGGIFLGWLLVIAIALGFKRFTRRMEVRADRLESQALADTNAYEHSLIKLHEANLAPAVMPGSQTHPHLYDRLLAGGIQPDFPRPKAPPRLKPFLAALAVTLATAGVMFLLVVAAMCAQRVVKALQTASAADVPETRELQPSQ